LLGIQLTRIVQNRDYPTSTHIVLDIGGGNQLAFFDFPEKVPARAVPDVGSMHHIAIKAQPENFSAVLARSQELQIAYFIARLAPSWICLRARSGRYPGRNYDRRLTKQGGAERRIE
jgi:hypothetical protein